MDFWRERLKILLINGLAFYGIGWTIVESISHFFTGLQVTGVQRYIFLVIFSILFGIWRAWPLRKVTIDLTNTDSSIYIRFGDLFSSTSQVVIPVNEYFDSILGNHVSESSLHGQFIKKLLGSQSVSFNKLVNNSLSDVSSEEISRASGNTKRYPIGTTAVVELENKNYYLFALSKTELDTLKAYAEVNQLFDGLSGLWNKVRTSSNGKDVAVPLVGSGQSGVGLPPLHLLNLLITSIVTNTKKSKITHHIHIVLPERLNKTIDLKMIKQLWG